MLDSGREKPIMQGMTSFVMRKTSTSLHELHGKSTLGRYNRYTVARHITQTPLRQPRNVERPGRYATVAIRQPYHEHEKLLHNGDASPRP